MLDADQYVFYKELKTLSLSQHLMKELQPINLEILVVHQEF